MKSYIILRKGKPYSTPLSTREEAEQKVEELSVIYAKESLEIVETNAEVIVHDTTEKTYEVVEDKGCASGACTL